MVLAYGQAGALAATGIVTLFGGILAFLMTQSYLRNRRSSHLFWSIGLWVFALSDFLEFVFALNVYSTLLMAIYLFIIVLLTQLLSLGSIQLVSSKPIRYGYTIFAGVIAIVVLISVLVGPISNLVMDYVVLGQPTLFIIISSSLGTFPAAAVLIWVAALGYKRTRSPKMLSIIAGVLVIGFAGTLYIATFPSFLYIAELFGVFLLFYGFYSPSYGKNAKATSSSRSKRQ